MKYEKTTHNKTPLAEETQDLDIKFCFMKEKKPGLMTNATTWSVCRDFLGDAVCGNFDKTKKNIYGFAFNPEKQSLDTTHCIIGLTFPNEEVTATFLKNLAHYFKDFLKSAKSKITYKVIHFKNQPNVLAIRCSSYWQQTTFNISLLSFVLKGCCWKLDTTKPLFDAITNTKNRHHCKSKEALYLACGIKELLLTVLPKLAILTKKHVHPHGWETDQNIGIIHNRSGFYYSCKWKRDTVIGKWLATAS